MSFRIPLSAPDITEREIDAVTAVLRSGTLSLGLRLEEFEQALASYHQMPFAIAVSSGTAALHLAIRALGIAPDDEVIVPSFSFVAVANTVLYERAVPVFADIDPVTMNLDPASVEAGITSRTKAIVIVHTFGIPAQMDALMTIARRHNIWVIEDACEAIGATYQDRLVGTLGDISVLAFYPNKQMTTGEGGAVLTRDPDIAARIRALRNQGRYASCDWFQHVELGYNYRLSEIACALGLVQLSRLPEILKIREMVARMYHELLSENHDVERPPLSLENCRISWFVYVIRLVLPRGAEIRDSLIEHLQRQGIGCARYFAPIHRQPSYASVASAQQAHLPHTDSMSSRTLALPFYNRLGLADIQFVTNALKDALKHLEQ